MLLSHCSQSAGVHGRRCPSYSSTSLRLCILKSSRWLREGASSLRHRQQICKPQATEAMSNTGPQSVIICGAGIIGAASAYYLAQQGIQCAVIERGGVACAASGKAGGFLAADWQDGSPTGPLARRSYELHLQLAKELGGAACGFREVETLSLDIAGRHMAKDVHLPKWIDGNISTATRMGSGETTAQVHPEKLTRALLEAAERMAGSRVQVGVVQGIETANGCVTGVRVDGRVLQAGKVVIAMGPWSGLARQWLPQAPPVLGQIGHSIVLQAKEALSAHCLFVNHRSKSGIPHSPEIFCRPDGTAYVVEGAEIVPLPDDPMHITPDEDKCSDLQEVASALSTSLAEGTVERKQACFRPYAPDGLPVIGPISGVNGVYIASGHGCWGILNGPATGEAIAYLVAGLVPTVNLRSFDPSRFRSNRYESK